jgi:Uma2 family endonuclease
MPVASMPQPSKWTVADLGALLGPMPLSRIRLDPRPGTATEYDVLALNQREDRLYELVEGILVEKTMGFGESLLAGFVGYLIRLYLNQFKPKRGVVSGADGIIKLAPGMVRIPDVAFFSMERFPDRRIPNDPIPLLAPDLAVEVLSINNTLQEMERKRKEYFQAGCRLVWEIDPRERIATVYTDPDSSTVLSESDTLDGGDVLPGFTLPLRQLFAEFDEM